MRKATSKRHMCHHTLPSIYGHIPFTSLSVVISLIPTHAVHRLSTNLPSAMLLRRPYPRQQDWSTNYNSVSQTYEIDFITYVT